MFLLLLFSLLLLCSFFRLKELFQVKNGLTTSLLFFLFNAENLGWSDDAKRTYRTSLWLVNRIIGAKHLKIRKSAIFGSVYVRHVRSERNQKGIVWGILCSLILHLSSILSLLNQNRSSFIYTIYTLYIHYFIKL